MKKIKIIIIIFILILVIFTGFFTTDLVRTKNDKKPVFAVKTAAYDDGGSIRYTGLFYNVYYIHTFSDDYSSEWLNEDGTIKEGYEDRMYFIDYEITPWFTSLSKAVEKSKERNKG